MPQAVLSAGSCLALDTSVHIQVVRNKLLVPVLRNKLLVPVLRVMQA
jgi:hypothetical protein